MIDPQFCTTARFVIASEGRAITALAQRIDNTFAQACQMLLACQGHIIVIGVGKSGHIARKIAATFASTGSPAFFVHASEASHGDLGMLTKADIILVISYSGETQEIINILSSLSSLQLPVIALTKSDQSTLAKHATLTLVIPKVQEADPLGLVPSTSTTASLVMGDALAIALSTARNFTASDFVKTHPKGSLGLHLSLRVSEIMRTEAHIPACTPDTMLIHAIVEMSKKCLGSILILDQDRKLIGIFTDGDLRRAVDQNIDLRRTVIEQHMHRSCKTITVDCLASEALIMMEEYKITALPVLDTDNTLRGVIHIHDLLSQGMRLDH